MQHLIMASLNETLQRRRFWNVVRRFHRNYMATSERRQIAMYLLHNFCEINKEVINPSYVEADKKFDLEFQPATCTWYSVNNNELNGKKIEMYTSSILISENLSNKYF